MDEALSPAAGLQAMLEVEQIDTDLFRGFSPAGTSGRVFGGQVVAQALAAASADLDGDKPDGRRAHSLHAYFLRAGDNAKPIIFRVLRDLDGGSFSHRRVVAIQDGKPILNLAASFHRPEQSFQHAVSMRDLPGPDDCEELTAMMARHGNALPSDLSRRLRPFELRTSLPKARDGTPARRFLWLRLASAMNVSATLSRVLLAYISDFALISTAVAPHAEMFRDKVMVVSLDHALWMHTTPVLDDWILYDMESPWAGNGRGLARGMFYDQAGQLIANSAQEGVCRMPVAWKDGIKRD